MARPSESAHVLVLAGAPGSERFENWDLFCPERGLLKVLRRVVTGKKTPPKPRPDLFDTGEAVIRPGAGNSWFLEDYAPRLRRAQLAHPYARLAAASHWAKLLRDNLTHLEEVAPLFALSERVFDSLQDGHAPEAVLLKSLYAWARDEGHPVREAWLTSLPRETQEQVVTILQTPLAELDEAAVADAVSLRENLQAYLLTETEMVLR